MSWSLMFKNEKSSIVTSWHFQQFESHSYDAMESGIVYAQKEIN